MGVAGVVSSKVLSDMARPFHVNRFDILAPRSETTWV